MTMIKKILFPVDFSPACVAMAPFVKKGAAMFSAQVTLIHVLEPPSSGFELYVRPLREVEEDREQVARAKLDLFLKSEFLPHESARLWFAKIPFDREITWLPSSHQQFGIPAGHDFIP
jgi:nucleotide-binding universal stress UspA family protein